MNRKKLILTFLLLCSVLVAQGQSINTKFGKNRVQHHDDFRNWWMYETENFITYWYGKARLIAEPVIQVAEMDHDEIQGIMEHRFNSKIEIVVYLDVSDLKQSNIGIEDAFINETGKTKIVGNKMFVYFDGNHLNLQKQIREGIASVYMNSMLFGNTLQEIVQNAVLLNLPAWFKDGLVSYVGSYWDHLKEDELRDILTTQDKYWEFEKLAREYPEIAGHSMWHFLDQAYGRQAISNILYLTRINRNLESSFLYVLSVSYDRIIEDWSKFYKSYFLSEENKFGSGPEPLKLDNKDYVPVSHLALSPEGNNLLYVYNDIGKYRVKIYSLADESSTEIFSKGYKNSFQETDYNYPLVAWHPRGHQVTVLYEDRDLLKLRRISLSSGEYEEEIIPERYHRVYSLDYLTDEQYVLSATTDGYSDLYTYKFDKRTTKRLTEDYHDDLDASAATYRGKRGILFSSNRENNVYQRERIDTTLPLNKYDIFFLPLGDESGRLERITFTPEVNERYPYFVEDDYLTYLSEKSGVTNRYVKLRDSDENGYCNSNFSRNLIRHHGRNGVGLHAYTYYEDGAYKTFIDYPFWDESVIPHITLSAKKGVEEVEEEVIIPLLPEEPELSDELMFQSEFDDPPVLEKIEDNPSVPFSALRTISSVNDQTKYKDVLKYVPARAVAARRKFRLDNFTTKMDNDVLFEGLESYAGQEAQLQNQPLGILLKATVKDLLEDHSLEGGMRFPTSFNGSEYFLAYENRTKKIDKKFAFYRKSLTNTLEETVFPVQKTKTLSHIALVQFKYPFDVYRSVRLTTSFRADRQFWLSSDGFSLNQPFYNEKRLSLRAEYVFDNSREISPNILNGTRYKAYAEAINRFDLNIVDNFNLEPSLGFTSIFGVDARHYIPVLEKGVLALRGAAAVSMGSEKMLYYLGGVENWLFSSFNNNTPVPSGSFAYQALAPQLRGFKSNIRNGASYVLLNAELRLPIFRLIKNGTVGSSLIRNFQVVLFYDAGTAWHGISPYNDDNPLNSTVISRPPTLNVTVNYFRDPLVMGYGFGVRTTLFGYFIKLDYAYGIETRRIQDPIFYFSLGTDF